MGNVFDRRLEQERKKNRSTLLLTSGITVAVSAIGSYIVSRVTIGRAARRAAAMTPTEAAGGGGGGRGR